jgi:hypothetical protein
MRLLKGQGQALKSAPFAWTVHSFFLVPCVSLLVFLTTIQCGGVSNNLQSFK